MTRLSDHCGCNGEVDEDRQQILDDRCERSTTEGRVAPRDTEQPREEMGIEELTEPEFLKMLDEAEKAAR